MRTRRDDLAVIAMVDFEARVREAVERELAATLAQRKTPRLRPEDEEWVYCLVGRAVAAEQQQADVALDATDCATTWRRVFGAVTPLGPLAEHLADPDVEEVRINGASTCFVLRQGRREEVPPPFESEEALTALVHWYCDGAGTARLDRASPAVTLTLPDGSRLHAALTPPARPMSVTIRRHAPERFRTLADLATAGLISDGQAPFLEAAVRGRLNIVVAGGTGTGKTTFIRALCRLVPPAERVVTIEDQAELHLWRFLPDCISLESRPANTEGRGAIGIQALVHEALRMSPDRIVIGEVRGAEALDLLDAMNTGHTGLRECPFRRRVLAMIEQSAATGIYVRISEDPELLRLGVQRQERDCRELAERHGWPVVGIYEDDDRSAFKRVTRPGYDALLTDIREGRIRRLVTWHPDRMHRQPRELEVLIDLVEEREVQIATVRAGQLDLSTPTGRMMARTIVNFAAYESDHKRDRIRRKMAELRERGAFHGGTRPFGWGPDGVTPIPNEVALLCEARDRALAGETLRGIAADFNRRGVVGTRGAALSSTALRKALVNPRVVGKYADRKGNVVGEARWKAIFSEADWTRLRLLLLDPSRTKNAGQRARKYLLSGGIARCALCGSAMVARPRSGPLKVAYYSCTNDPQNGRHGCGKVHIQTAILDQLAADAAMVAIDSPDFRRAALEAAGAHDRGMAEALAERKAVEARLEELAAGYGRGDMTYAEWMAAKQPLLRRQEAAQARIEASERGRRLESVLQLESPRDAWGRLPLDRRRAVISTLLERVDVGPHVGSRRTFNASRVNLIWRV